MSDKHHLVPPLRPKDTQSSDEDDGDAHSGSERDQMIPKQELYSRNGHISTAPSLRSRLFKIIIGLAVCVIAASFVTFYILQDSEWQLPRFPNPISFPKSAGGQTPAPAPVKKPRPRKAVVVASYKGQRTGWLENLPKYTRGWQVFHYESDNPKTEYLKVPSKLGREAMTYLTYIIDNYNQLPDFTVFVHGHDQAWHQPEHTIDKLMAINLTAVAQEGYVNLRCALSPGCTEDTKFYFHPPNKQDSRPGMAVADGFWKHMMAHEFGDLPPVFGRRCCAQFAVTKKAIRLRSLSFWKSLRKPLLGNMQDMKKMWGSNIDQYRLGSLYEQVWHILFGKTPNFCPDRSICDKIHFSDMIHCDGETTSFKENAGNWGKIKCVNELRQAIDSGTPLESVFPNDIDPPRLPPQISDGV